jgi:hypothetical protein
LLTTEGIRVAQYFVDLTIVALLVIGITAVMGVLVNGIGQKLFGGSGRMENVNQTAKTQTGWKLIGGKK